MSDLVSIEEGMHGLLVLACDFTDRESGFLGLFDHRGRISRRITHELRNELPNELLHRARRQTVPFVHVSRDGDRTIERVVVGIGPRGDGVLVLETPKDGAPAGEKVVPVVHALAQLIWSRLSELEEIHELRSQVTQARFKDSPSSATVLASARLVGTRLKLRQAAWHDRAVFLQGEEGTEKEDLARFLHAESPERASNPFVAIHADTASDNTVLEELFGGASAAADTGSAGCLKTAERGTLFIESPECLSPDVQSRLIQHLESGAGVRLVTCSTESTSDLVREGRLNPGLAEHMQQVKVVVPPLRSKPSDVSSLVDLILREMGPSPNGSPRAVSEKALQMLVSYPWPKNVRELRQVLEVAAAKAGGRPIMPKDLPAQVVERASAGGVKYATLREVEKKHITEVIFAVKSKREASKVLGIAPSTLYEKLSKYDIRT